MASNTTDFTVYYAELSRVAYATVCPILMGIGICGTVLGGIVFGHNTMRKNPSALYFIAFNVFSFLFMSIVWTTLAVQNILNFRLVHQSAVWCKIYQFWTAASPALSRYSLVINSIDRSMVTSSNATVRRQSTYRFASWMIGGMTCTILLFYVHIPVGYDLYLVSPGPITCRPRPGTYYYFSVYSNVIVNIIIPFTLMAVFAIQTLRNLKRVRVQPMNAVSTVPTTLRSRDRQFTILLLTEVAIYLLFSLFTAGFNLYALSTQFQTKSNYQRGLDQYLQTVSYLCTFVPPAISFYQNLIVSTAFRHTAVKLLFNRFQQRLIHSNSAQPNENIVVANRSYQQ